MDRKTDELVKQIKDTIERQKRALLVRVEYLSDILNNQTHLDLIDQKNEK